MEESKMQKIKEYIEKCPLLNKGKINVDYLKDSIDSYSIDRTPSNPIVEKWVTGYTLKQITFDFTVQAPFGSQAIVNLANSKFCEDFMEWIEKQNKSGELPDIDGIESIECTSPGYILQKTETTAIYIIQLKIKYHEN